MSTDTDKLNAVLNDLCKSVEKDDFASVGLGQNSLSFVPYGSRSLPELDLCLHRDGLPFGRIVELYGWEHCGKSTFAMLVAAAVQRMGGVVLWIDTEQSFLERRAVEVGVNLTQPHFIKADCNSIESIVRIQENMMGSLDKNGIEAPVCFIIDSITGPSTESEVTNDFSMDQRIGQAAKQIRAAMRRLSSQLAKHSILSVYVNHNIGDPKSPTGSTSAGGHALKFFASVRLELAHEGWINKVVKGQQIHTGQLVKFRVRKNKVGPVDNFQFSTPLHLETGFNVSDSLLDSFVSIGHIKAPSNYSRTAASVVYNLNSKGFKRAEWPAIIESDLGGINKAYETFYQLAEEANKIIPYRKG